MAQLTFLKSLNTITDSIGRIFDEGIDNDDMLAAQEDVRLKGIKNAWDMYKGNHWLIPDNEEGEPLPVVNKVELLVDMVNAFMAGKPATFTYPDVFSEKKLGPIINYIFNNSGGMSFLRSCILMGSITGDVFIGPVLTERGKIKLKLYDSSEIFPRYENIDDNEYPTMLEHRYKILRKEGGKNRIVLIREVWTPELFKVYEDSKKEPKEVSSNLLGFIPFVHIRNKQVGKDVYGKSDIYELSRLNEQLNDVVAQYKDASRDNSDPILAVFGAKVGTIEKNSITGSRVYSNLPSPRDADIKYLSPNTDFPALQKMMEYIDGYIHEVGRLPKDVTQGKLSISNTSAVALHYALMPIISLVDLKKDNYSRGIENAIKLSMKFALKLEEFTNLPAAEVDSATKNAINSALIVRKLTSNAKKELEDFYSKHEDPYMILTEWNDFNLQFTSYLPKDELSLLSQINMELTLGLESRKGAMKRLGKDNIENILAEIESDELQQKLIFKGKDKEASLEGTSGGMLIKDKTIQKSKKGAKKDENA